MIASIKTTLPGAEIIAEIAIRNVGTRGRRALALNVMMMAFLHRANLRLKAKHARAVLAQRAVGWRHLSVHLRDALGKGRQHLIMIIQVPSLDELDIRMSGGHLIGEPIDAVDQYTPVNRKYGKTTIRR